MVLIKSGSLAIALKSLLAVVLLLVAFVVGASSLTVQAQTSRNYSNGERVTCEGVIKRDPKRGVWLDSFRMCSQSFLQHSEKVLKVCPETSRCEVTAIIFDDKREKYGFGQVLKVEFKGLSEPGSGVYLPSAFHGIWTDIEDGVMDQE